MRTIRELLRQKWHSGLSNRDIAASCRIGETTVRSCIRRAELAGPSWPLPETLTDAALEQIRNCQAATITIPCPDNDG